MVMQPVSSWGRLTHAPHDVVALTDRLRAAAVVAASRQPALPFGNGRSYGDVCLNESGVLWSTRDLDRFIAFDPSTGRLECEAGVTLDEIIAIALPQGWFPPVTPGTRYITLGGAIANDVHGKNHHGAGTFGEHVESLTLLRTEGRTIVCGPDRLEIHSYYFPVGSKNVPYTQIQGLQRIEIKGLWSGRWRLWGTVRPRHFC
jgi:FAD/FMN-containing dehydrogenase